MSERIKLDFAGHLDVLALSPSAARKKLVEGGINPAGSREAEDWVSNPANISETLRGLAADNVLAFLGQSTGDESFIKMVAGKGQRLASPARLNSIHMIASLLSDSEN